RYDDREWNSGPGGKRIAEAEPGKARQQAEVLVEGKELEDRRLPADQREFKEKAESCGEGNRQIEKAGIEGVEKRHRPQRVGIEGRLEFPQHRKKRQGGNRGRAEEQGAFEYKRRPQPVCSEPGDQGAFQRSPVPRSEPQADWNDDEENDEYPESDGR